MVPILNKLNNMKLSKLTMFQLIVHTDNISFDMFITLIQHTDSCPFVLLS